MIAGAQDLVNETICISARWKALSLFHAGPIDARVVGFRGRLRFDTFKPDGAPRKLLDSGRIHALGWRDRARTDAGIAAAYKDFLKRFAG